jgi:carboxylesterase type B
MLSRLLPVSFALSLLGSSYAAPGPGKQGTPTVKVPGGTVTGVATNVPGGPPVNKFLGLPFAVSPPKRFAPPQALPKGSNKGPPKKIDATTLPPSCIQQFVCKFHGDQDSEVGTTLTFFSPSSWTATDNVNF